MLFSHLPLAGILGEISGRQLQMIFKMAGFFHTAFLPFCCGTAELSEFARTGSHLNIEQIH